MKYHWLTEDENGVSYFEDREIALTPTNFAPPAPLVHTSGAEEASKLMFLSLPVGWTGKKHRSPVRQVLFCLSGKLHVEAGNGEVREIVQGDIWHMEDCSGSGHITTVIGDEDVNAGVVQLD